MIIVTFDEGNLAGKSQILTIVIANHGPRRVTDKRSYNHYSLLASLQKPFGLGCLLNSCSATAMSPLFAITGSTTAPTLPPPYNFPTSSDTISARAPGGRPLRSGTSHTAARYSSRRSRLLASLPGTAPEEEAACDAVTVPREIPVTHDNAEYVDSDRKLVAAFREFYQQRGDEELPCLYALCAICLTPVADTGDLISFLADNNMWTAEAAVKLLELRRYESGIEQLERLAREGWSQR